jgi:hypothetical protein
MSFAAMPSMQQYKPHTLPDIVISVCLILVIVFSEDTPLGVKLAVSSAVGPVAMFLAVLGLMWWRGPLVGLIAAGAAIALYNSALIARQGFADYQFRRYTNENRWFIEKALGERPAAVEFEKVETLPAN